MADKPRVDPPIADEPNGEADRFPTRFKDGVSGNPRGRPPGRKKSSKRLQGKADLERALSKEVTVRENDRTRTMSRLRMGYEQLAIAHANGDRHARREIADYAERFGIDILGLTTDAHLEPLEPPNQDILDRYFARRCGEVIAAEPRVLAAPELLNEPTDTPAEASAPDVAPPPHHVQETRYGDRYGSAVPIGGGGYARRF